MQSENMWTAPPTTGYVNVYPGAQGGNEWSPEAYSPDTPSVLRPGHQRILGIQRCNRRG